MVGMLSMHDSHDNHSHKTVVDLFYQTVNQFPDKEAVIFKSSTSEEIWTYSQFNQLINQLALKLSSEDVKPGSLVALLIHSSAEMFAAIFAIWKLGAAYLPLSKELPQERIEFILKDSSAKCILTTHESFSLNAGIQCRIILLGDKFQGNHFTNVISPCKNVSPSDLAYAIYTSGSTGSPKGALINHQSLINAMNGFNAQYPIKQRESFLVKTSLMFDASLVEYLWPLLHGSQIVIIDEISAKNPDVILNIIFDYQITRILFVPSLFSVFLTYVRNEIDKLNSLKYIFVGGEILHASVVKKFNALNIKADLINCYGPTETTIAATLYSVKEWNGTDSIPIGKPMLNVQTFVINEAGEIALEGEWGELYIAGDGVCNGYINRATLNSERFISAPYASGKIYRTGDRVRMRLDGNLEYQGRIDNQVKIRGFRIELDEIESTLASISDIIMAAVINLTLPNQSQYLCAYYTAKTKLENETILRHLADKLPSYMIPTQIIYLCEMPMLASGKINRQSLFILSQSSIKHDNLHKQFIHTSIREKLIRIWASILNIDEANLDLDQHFLSLGGDSLRLIEMASKVHDEIGLDLSFDIFLQYSSLRALGDYLEKIESLPSREVISSINKQVNYPLSSAQMRMYLLYLREGKFNMRYNISGMLDLQGVLDLKKLEFSLISMMMRHAVLRTSIKIDADAMPVQVIGEDARLIFDHSICENVEEAGKYFSKFKSAFNITKAPLIKFHLLQLANCKNKYILLFDADHMIFDGMSIRILVEDLLNFYHHYPIRHLSSSYIDHVYDEKSPQFFEKMKEKKQYWIDYLKDFIPAKIMYDDYRSEFDGVQNGQFDKSACECIDILCKKLEISRFAFILSAFFLSIYQITNQKDLTIASAFSCRSNTSFNTIGNFVNVFLIRNNINEEEMYSDFVRRIMGNLKKSMSHADFPFELLSENFKNLAKNGNSDISIFVNHFSYPNQQTKNRHSDSQLTISFNNIDIPTAKYDLSLYIFDTPENIVLNLVYFSPMYCSDKMKKLLNNMVGMIHQILAQMDAKLSEIILIDTPNLILSEDIRDLEFEAFE